MSRSNFGQGSAGSQVDGGIDVRAAVHQPLAQRFELGLRREVGEAAHRHGDRVGVPAGNGRADIAGQLLHAQGAQHHIRVRWLPAG